MRTGQSSCEDRQTFFKPGCVLSGSANSDRTKGRPAGANVFTFQTKNGGAGRDRTDDLKLAKLPLSQLSYGPFLFASNASSDIPRRAFPRKNARPRAALVRASLSNQTTAKLLRGQPAAAHVCASISNQTTAKLLRGRTAAAHVCASQKINGGPGTTRTSDLTLIRGAL